MAALSDEEMAAKTEEFRQRLAQGATVDELLVEAYALFVRPINGSWVSFPMMCKSWEPS